MSSYTAEHSVAPEPSSVALYPWALSLNLVNSSLGARDIGTHLTRGYLAQIVVNYAVNVLKWEIPNKVPTYCYFKDGSNAWTSPEAKSYAIQSCQLGLMGLEMDYFQPYTEVTYAQLAIVLYRLLYDASYIGKQAPWELPLDTLMADGLFFSIDSPQESIVSVEFVLDLLMNISK